MQTYDATTGVFSPARDMITKTSLLIERYDSATVATAGAATYTAAAILGGIIARDPAGAGRTDVLPTAALLVAAMKEEEVGDTLECYLINQADANETITLTAGAGGTLINVSGNDTVTQNTARIIVIRITAVATPTYDAYLI